MDRRQNASTRGCRPKYRFSATWCEPTLPGIWVGFSSKNNSVTTSNVVPNSTGTDKYMTTCGQQRSTAVFAKKSKEQFTLNYRGRQTGLLSPSTRNSSVLSPSSPATRFSDLTSVIAKNTYTPASNMPLTFSELFALSKSGRGSSVRLLAISFLSCGGSPNIRSELRVSSCRR